MGFQAEGGWALDPVCPCDVQFVEYCRERGVRGRAVFHMGSGLHHLVGQELCRPELNNAVLSVTQSRAELLAYADRVLAEPEFGRRYKLLFSDVHALAAEALPEFDMVALFHLGEGQVVTGVDPAQAFVEGMEVVSTFRGRLRPGGRMLFYDRSTGGPVVRGITSTLARTGALRAVETYHALSIWEA